MPFVWAAVCFRGWPDVDCNCVDRFGEGRGCGESLYLVVSTSEETDTLIDVLKQGLALLMYTEV